MVIGNRRSCECETGHHALIRSPLIGIGMHESAFQKGTSLQCTYLPTTSVEFVGKKDAKRSGV